MTATYIGIEIVIAQPLDGCTGLTNAAGVAGKIALVQRGGGCSFTTKVSNAESAGAVAAVVYDDTAVCLDSYEQVQRWDCAGNDIESLTVDWAEHSDLERCAARCMELGDECVGFSIGRQSAEAAAAIQYDATHGDSDFAADDINCDGGTC